MTEKNTARTVLFYALLLILWSLCLMVGEGDADVVVSETEVHRVVSDYVREMLSDFEGQVEVQARQRGDLHVEGVGAVTLKVRSTSKRSGSRSVPVMLEVYRGPVMVRDYLLSAEVRYYDDVVVASRQIERNEPVVQDALSVETQEITGRLGRYFRSVSDLKGMRTRTRIVAGRQVDPRRVERIPAVERRDQVHIRAEIGGVAISTLGEATESGAVGDRILVENLSSGEKVSAVVVGPGVVRVLF